MNTTTKLFFALAAVCTVPALAACGGDIGAGKFAQYRVASSGSPKFSGASCNIDPTHKTTFEGGATFLIYGIKGDDGDELKLDTGKQVLDGSKEDDGSYSFKGVTTDFTVTGQTTVTTTLTTTISLTAAGKTITGDRVDDGTVTCSGQCNGFQPAQCATTVSFEGVEIKNPQAPDPDN